MSVSIVNLIKNSRTAPISTIDLVVQLPIQNSMVHFIHSFILLDFLFRFRFTDTLTLSFGTVPVPVDKTGITWTTDRAVKFKNPSDPDNCNENLWIVHSIDAFVCLDFTNDTRPPNWQITAWDFDRSNLSNNGYQNEDFIVWMRTAAMPTFRKLYRKLTSMSTGSFQSGLPQGNYTLTVEYSKKFYKTVFFLLKKCSIKIILCRASRVVNNLLLVRLHGWVEKILFSAGRISS